MIERRAALRALAERRRGEDEHEWLLRRDRIGDRGLVEALHGRLVGRDLRDVTADVREGRRLGRWRLVADRDASRLVEDVELHVDGLGRLARELRREAGGIRAGVRQLDVGDVDATHVLDAPHESPFARRHGRRLALRDELTDAVWSGEATGWFCLSRNENTKRLSPATSCVEMGTGNRSPAVDADGATLALGLVPDPPPQAATSSATMTTPTRDKGRRGRTTGG